MAPPEIANYIRQAKARGLTDEQIQQQLLAVGWNQTEVQNAMQSMRVMQQAEEQKPGWGSKLAQVAYRLLRLALGVVLIVLMARVASSFVASYFAIDVRQHPVGQLFDMYSAYVIFPPMPLVEAALQRLLTQYNLNYFAGLDILAILTMIAYGVLYLIILKTAQWIGRLLK